MIDTGALLDALNTGKVRGAGLDVYEEEADLFFEDNSGSLIQDDQAGAVAVPPQCGADRASGFPDGRGAVEHRFDYARQSG